MKEEQQAVSFLSQTWRWCWQWWWPRSQSFQSGPNDKTLNGEDMAHACKWSHLVSFKSLHLEDLQVFALNVQAFFLRTVLSSALQFKNSLCKICNLYHHYQDWRIVRSAISIDKTFTMKYPITEDPGFKKNLIISLSLLPVFSPYNWLFELPLNARNMATENN